MHAAARAKTPRTKPAADPWQALPGLADLFDSQTPQPFFKGSKVSALEELALTETKLLEQTASILGISLAQLVKAGTLVYAKREFLNHNKYSAAEGGDSESALLRSGSGVAGVAANPPIPITPAKLATRALTGYPTALRWLKIHHPELLVSKPDEASVAPVAVAPVAPVVAPEPKPEPETVVQKQPESAPKKRSTAKASAKLLPKPLRNPKTHPELLADDHHAKTALKPSDTAQGDHAPPRRKNAANASVTPRKSLSRRQTCPGPGEIRKTARPSFFMPKNSEQPASWRAFTKPPSRRAQPEEPVALDFGARAQDFLNCSYH
jgi:hypothetical protein